MVTVLLYWQWSSLLRLQLGMTELIHAVPHTYTFAHTREGMGLRESMSGYVCNSTYRAQSVPLDFALIGPECVVELPKYAKGVLWGTSVSSLESEVPLSKFFVRSAYIAC